MTAGYTTSCDTYRPYRIGRADPQQRLSRSFSNGFGLVFRERGATPRTRSRRCRRLRMGGPAGLLDNVRILEGRPRGTGARIGLRCGYHHRRSNNRDATTGLFPCRNYRDRSAPAGRPRMAHHPEQLLRIFHRARPSVACTCGALLNVGTGGSGVA